MNFNKTIFWVLGLICAVALLVGAFLFPGDFSRSKPHAIFTAVVNDLYVINKDVVDHDYNIENIISYLESRYGDIYEFSYGFSQEKLIFQVVLFTGQVSLDEENVYGMVIFKDQFYVLLNDDLRRSTPISSDSAKTILSSHGSLRFNVLRR